MAMDYGTDDELNLMMKSSLVDADRFDEARRYMDKGADQLPKKPLRRYNSEIRLRELRHFVAAAEHAAHSEYHTGNGEQMEVD